MINERADIGQAAEAARMEPLLLRGALVHLDPLLTGDIPALLAAAQEGREAYGYTLVPQDAAAMQEYVDSALADRASGWGVPFAIRDARDHRVVGSTRFLDLQYWEGVLSWPPGRPTQGGVGIPSAAEIGSTWLSKAAQGTGINVEAKYLMLQYAFEEWKVERVSFKTDARNERSRQAIEKLGATFEGIRRRHTMAVDGSLRDSAYYSIVAEEWPVVQAALTARLKR